MRITMLNQLVRWRGRGRERVGVADGLSPLQQVCEADVRHRRDPLVHPSVDDRAQRRVEAHGRVVWQVRHVGQHTQSVVPLRSTRPSWLITVEPAAIDAGAALSEFATTA